MSEHAVRVRAPSGWVDLAYIATGPVGPKGDKGDKGDPGNPIGPAGGDLEGSFPNPTIRDRAVTSRDLLLDHQIIDGGQPANLLVNLPASNFEMGRNGLAGTDWRLTYTPPVDVWWEVSYRVPQLSKSVDGWAYLTFDVMLVEGVIPATATTYGVAVGGGVTRGIFAIYGPGGPPYGGVEAKRTVPLTGGVKYTVRPVVAYNGANWQLQLGSQHNPLASAKAWAR